MTKTQTLQQSKYNDRLMTESEVFDGIAYEIKSRAICVMVWQNGRKTAIYGKIDEMRKLAQEITELCDCWDDIRT